MEYVVWPSWVFLKICFTFRRKMLTHLFSEPSHISHFSSGDIRSWGPSAETFGVIFTMLLRSTPVGGRGSQETRDGHQPLGPAAVTPGVPSAGTTLLWRPSGICPALHPTPPCLGRAQQPCLRGVWGLCTLALSSQWGQRSSEDARQCFGDGCTLPGGLRGECNLWSPP